MARVPSAVRIAAGVIFVVAGIAKFAVHASEVQHFRTYGLPVPSATVAFVGLLELIGGVLLVADRLVRPIAALLAITMAVAIAVSGIGQGEAIPSLTLAPVLLVVMGWLVLAKPDA